MNRKEFLKKMSLMGTVPFVLNSIPFKLMAGNEALMRMAANCEGDRVLVFIQLHGGNDGLNTLIPVSNYDLYQNVRPNIAIPSTGFRRFINLDSTLGSDALIGLHPDMTGMKNLYDNGKLAIVQGVGYENHNQSHFRGRDILFMGGGSNDYLSSGWIGRYLKDNVAPEIYPDDFPNPAMQDPLALEFGNEISLIFHQGENIPTSISIYNPQQFFDLVNTLPGFEDVQGTDPRGIPPAALNNSPYGKEMNWILGLEQKTDEYDDRLKQMYDAGKAMDPGIVYPSTYPLNAPIRSRNNPLSEQLKIIANLIHGGSKTKVYLVRLGGFDTHAQQVEASDFTMGSHAALLYHLSSAMNAFQEDLKARNIENKVLSVTSSEFGRRIHSNGSRGTDHGIGGPMFLFGKGVNPGVIGNAPDMNLENVTIQYDYRQVYATIMKEWMCVDPNLVDSQNGIFYGDYPGRGVTLDLIDNNAVGVRDFIQKRFHLNPCYPNPAFQQTTFSFYINADVDVHLYLSDIQGKPIKSFISGRRLNPGEHSINVDLRDIPAGTYIYTIKAGLLNDAKQLQIIKNP
ncbi:MAG: DUF1501 domain-containing protein [Cytophagaceae bacterium]|jgi:uncharacterized protein (DUF1501 family)|nr:DUF1501 domain-containing protein [Cytophagaceae bacterium]